MVAPGLDLGAYCSDEKALEELMQKKAKVALDEGYFFGEEGIGFERINVAAPRSMVEECMRRIREAVEGLGTSGYRISLWIRRPRSRI